ncbi:hypothetical protein L2X99_09680 [Microbacterium sp. KUDC0406]|uniref:hypothetical protein n=1 Tax=Microbacterium sp. KUDC0406 TaxID=2909588 RepID=UPI001F25747A|nr:hypothetical protein [Microbacterium sp. KUDC0406]UJP08785.1 hypothetical protein L2X99_09680 [Microbacterium sp. KUDC0406]
MRTRRSIGVVAIAATCLAGLAAVAPAVAAEPLLTEDFSTGSAQQVPSGWAIDNENVAGMRDGWQGWTFHTTAEVVSAFGDSGDRASFGKGQGMVAVVESDLNRPATGRFDSVLWAPQTDLIEKSGAVRVRFDSHYKQGQAPQTAQLVARFDDGDPVVVQSFATNRLDESVDLTVDVPAGTDTVQVGWSYLQSSNNWFWMIDNVQISESAPAPVTPSCSRGRSPSQLPAARPG